MVFLLTINFYRRKVLFSIEPIRVALWTIGSQLMSFVGRVFEFKFEPLKLFENSISIVEQTFDLKTRSLIFHADLSQLEIFLTSKLRSKHFAFLEIESNSMKKIFFSKILLHFFVFLILFVEFGFFGRSTFDVFDLYSSQRENTENFGSTRKWFFELSRK